MHAITLPPNAFSSLAKQLLFNRLNNHYSVNKLCTLFTLCHEAQNNFKLTWALMVHMLVYNKFNAFD